MNRCTNSHLHRTKLKRIARLHFADFDHRFPIQIIVVGDPVTDVGSERIQGALNEAFDPHGTPDPEAVWVRWS